MKRKSKKRFVKPDVDSLIERMSSAIDKLIDLHQIVVVNCLALESILEEKGFFSKAELDEHRRLIQIESETVEQGLAAGVEGKRLVELLEQTRMLISKQKGAIQ